MDDALRKQWMMVQQDQQISEAIEREQARLRNFIRRRVADRSDAEDILQEVFYELVEAYRMMKPVEQVTSWLFQVARNRITDLFRSKQREASTEPVVSAEDGEEFQWEDLLPSPDAGPESAYVRSVLLEEMDAALDELPPRLQLQRACRTNRSQREHLALAQALRGGASASAAPDHL
jgi:RNA polymerase sigma factor (sigma-70 family)